MFEATISRLPQASNPKLDWLHSVIAKAVLSLAQTVVWKLSYAIDGRPLPIVGEICGLESRQGSGTFVSRSLPDQLLSCEYRGATPDETSSSPRHLSKVSALLPSRVSQPWTLHAGAFSVGQLAFDHFPFQIWSSLLARHARKVSARSLNYGESLGSKEFRETIATYLRTSRAVHCEASQIMVVSGSQQALDLVARVLLDPGSPMWVEEPGYGLMRYAFALAGCRLIPVPVDSEGMHVAAGVRHCYTARAAYVTPSHQFPLGVTMSASRRLQLLDWAHNAGSWIVEDDYDSEYRYESVPIASLQGLDRGSRVIYIGTFSKTLFPSLRLGYMVIPTDLVERFEAVRRAVDICSPQFTQAVLADFIDQGHFARHIRKTRLVYGERRSALAHAIRQEFGDRLQIVGGEAGMHLTVILPPGSDDQELSIRGAEENLWLWPLSASYFGKPAHQGFILGFGSTKTADIPDAVRRLKELLK
jgi:GntR family transcriptional regulator/MocR family aminotransferase